MKRKIFRTATAGAIQLMMAGIKEKLDADSEEVIGATQAAFVIEEAVRFEISPT